MNELHSPTNILVLVHKPTHTHAHTLFLSSQMDTKTLSSNLWLGLVDQKKMGEQRKTFSKLNFDILGHYTNAFAWLLQLQSFPAKLQKQWAGQW